MSLTDRFILLLAAFATSTVSACSADSASPLDPTGGSAAAAVAVDSALGTDGTDRIEIKLYPGELVAREVHIETDDAEEKIVSRVSGFDPAGGALTLELGGLIVGYGAGTRFRTQSESNASREAWEALVAAELVAGGRPRIEARRNPSGAPQAPDDPTFVAADLRLASETDEPEIEIYVDQDNLVSADGNSAVLRVLGLSITVNTRTRLGPDDSANPGQPTGSIEFQMAVSAVDASAATLTLSSGTVIRVTPATVISAEGDLFTLESMASAVAQGRPVRAEGFGAIVSAGPPSVIEAATLKVEVDG